MRTVIITGGSRGIGRAAVRRFAGEGDQVYFLYEKSTDAARQLAVETGAVAIPCDVTDAPRVAEVFSRFSRIDVLINNAGIVDYNPINWTEPEVFRRVMDVNVTGAFLCARAALPAMLQRQQFSHWLIIRRRAQSHHLPTPPLCGGWWAPPVRWPTPPPRPP